MVMDRNSENITHIAQNQMEEKKDKYTPRPKGHLILAWILIAIVLFAFIGMCYWMAFYGKG